MPSPFPGMDPFLEHPGVFPDLHDSLIFCLRESMQARLPEPYFAMIRDRLWVEVSERFIELDVHVRKGHAGEVHPAGKGDEASVGMLTRTKPVVVPVRHDERREPFVEIYVRDASGERVVTIVEILSPSNKAPGEQGRDLYLAKQREVLRSRIHLVEIDLLRGGEHTTAVPRKQILEAAGAFDYHVSLRLYNVEHSFYVYPIGIAERLPVIEVPLLPGALAVEVDLQAVLDRAYEAGPYSRKVRYDVSQLSPPLEGEKLEWCQRMLESFLKK